MRGENPFLWIVRPNGVPWILRDSITDKMDILRLAAILQDNAEKQIKYGINIIINIKTFICRGMKFRNYYYYYYYFYYVL